MTFSQHKSHLRGYLKSHKDHKSPDNSGGISQKDETKSSRVRAICEKENLNEQNKSSNGESTKHVVNRTRVSDEGSRHAAQYARTKQDSSESAVSSTRDKQSSKPQSSNVAAQSRTSTKERVAYRQKLAAMKLAYSNKSGGVPIDWLPDEIIIGIFSYFAPQDLLSCARVCKRWHGLASDNLLWQQIYKGYANKVTKAQKGKKTNNIPKNPPISFWKTYCVQRGAEFRNTRAMKLLQQKKLHPFTGLQKGTQEAIKKSGLQWVLCFVDDDSQEHTVFHKDVFFFNMSASVRWYNFEFPSIHRIKKLRIYSGNPIFFDEKGHALPNSPLQRSILYEREFKLGQIISGKSPLAADDIIKAYDLSDGLFIATWKDENNLAFISMSFHLDNLAQRCLQGTGSRPWMPLLHKPFRDDIDKRYDGHAVMQLIDPERSFERSCVERKIYLPWKTEALKGIVQDVCLIDVTLLDDQRNPIWCSSGLAKLSSEGDPSRVTYEYDGNYSTITYADQQCGKVVMILIWEESSNKFYITGLQLHLSLQLINYWFGRRY